MRCRSFKHNGDIAKQFHGLHKILERDDVIVLHSDIGARVDVVNKNTHWIAHYAAYQVFPVGAYYNFIIMEKENGNEYYCNLASPPIVTADEITYIDYDIDVILAPTGEIEVHDVEQFQERIVMFGYPAELVEKILQTKSWLEENLKSDQGFFATGFYKQLADTKQELLYIDIMQNKE